MGYSITDSCAENSCTSLRAFFAQEPRVVLFGAGKNGEFLSHYLRYAGLDAECFIDNAPQRAGMVINGLRVESPATLKDQSVVITSELHADAILAQLLGMGMTREHVYVVRLNELQKLFDTDPDWPAYIITHHFSPMYRDYFVAHGIDCSGDLLEHGGYRFPNPYRQTAEYQIAFFSEIVDYILPAMFDDYSMLVEGPGELGEVRIAPGDVVFDCGANIGLFSMVAAAKGGNVFAFEPVPAVAQHIRQAQRIYPSIQVIEQATSDNCGTARITLSSGANTGNSLVLPVAGKSISIATTTLDDFVARHDLPRVDFIKADIEGAERLMLQGAQQTLRRFAPKLSICTYHLPDDKEVLEALIRQANPDYVIEHRWQKLYAHVPARRGEGA